MPLVVRCRCGKRFAANESLAGRTLPCPDCGESIHIPQTTRAPQTSSGNKLVVQCANCGARHGAREELFGTTVSCPTCGGAIAVPYPQSSMETQLYDPAQDDLFADVPPASASFSQSTFSTPIAPAASQPKQAPSKSMSRFLRRSFGEFFKVVIFRDGSSAPLYLAPFFASLIVTVPLMLSIDPIDPPLVNKIKYCAIPAGIIFSILSVAIFGTLEILALGVVLRPYRGFQGTQNSTTAIVRILFIKFGSLIPLLLLPMFVDPQLALLIPLGFLVASYGGAALSYRLDLEFSPLSAFATSFCVQTLILFLLGLLLFVTAMLIGQAAT